MIKEDFLVLSLWQVHVSIDKSEVKQNYRPVAEMVSKLDVMSNLESSYCLARVRQ